MRSSSDVYQKEYIKLFIRILMGIVISKIVFEMIYYAPTFSGEVYPRYFLLDPKSVGLLRWPIYFFVLVTALITIYKPHLKKIHNINFIGFSTTLLFAYSNHKYLITLILLSLVFFKEERVNDNEKMKIQCFGIIKNIVIIMYIFAFANKLNSEFLSGHVLAAIFSNIQLSPFRGIFTDIFWNRVQSFENAFLYMSYITLIFQGTIPLLLLYKPIIGFVLVICFHLALASLIPGIWFFTAACILIASLFVFNHQDSKLLGGKTSILQE